jgi:hypothetical protein
VPGSSASGRASGWGAVIGIGRCGMSELLARLGLYVAIDEAAARDERALAAAADVIPLYRNDLEAPDLFDPRRGTVGWSRSLPDLLPEVTVPSLEESLGELESLTDPVELEQARRIKAIWALSRVVPDADHGFVARTLEPLVRTALAEDPERSSEARSSSDRTAPDVTILSPMLLELTNLVTTDRRFRRAEDWPDLVVAATQQKLISNHVAQLARTGCEDWDKFATVNHDGHAELDPAARIVVTIKDFDVGTRKLAWIENKLKPSHWPTCLGSFWCSMTVVPVPPHLALGPRAWYREVVGDCPTGHWFRPYLVFATVDLSSQAGLLPGETGFELQYDLATASDLHDLHPGASSPLVQDPKVEVDSGIVKVVYRPAPGAAAGHHVIDITTSKTIRFRQPLPTGGVALLACVSGWADQTRMMITGCLSHA